MLRNPTTQALSISAPTSYQGATLVYFTSGWHKYPLNNQSGNNIFSLKRSNSIAQSMYNPNTQANLPVKLPPANGPSEASPQSISFLLDTSAVRGAYWGFAGSAVGVLLNLGAGYQSWTDINTQSLHSGAYPNSKVGGYGYVTWNTQNGFFWEDGINLKANHTIP